MSAISAGRVQRWAACSARCERAGDQDRGQSRERAAGQGGDQMLGRVAVGGDEHARGRDRAAGRAQGVAAAGPLPGGDRRGGVDSGAGRLGRGGEPADVAQRVQAEIVGHARGSHAPREHRAAAPPAPRGSRPASARRRGAPPVRPCHAARGPDWACGPDRCSPSPVGLDVEALAVGEAADERHALLLAGEVAARLLQPEPLGHGAIAELGPTQPAEPAIAPRSPPADRPRLQHDGLDAMLAGKVVGAGKPGIPTPDDRDLGTPYPPGAEQKPAPARRRWSCQKVPRGRSRS